MSPLFLVRRRNPRFLLRCSRSRYGFVPFHVDYHRSSLSPAVYSVQSLRGEVLCCLTSTPDNGDVFQPRAHQLRFSTAPWLSWAGRLSFSKALSRCCQSNRPCPESRTQEFMLDNSSLRAGVR